MVRTETKLTDTAVVQVYMPTMEGEDEEAEQEYEGNEEVIRYMKGDKNVIIMGDWNASVGRNRWRDCRKVLTREKERKRRQTDTVLRKTQAYYHKYLV